MANLNSTNLSDSVKTLYEKRLLSRAVPRFVHGKWGEVARLSRYGSYEMRKYSAMSAITTAITEGSTPAEQSAPTISTITMTPSLYGSWISYTDEIEWKTMDPMVSEVTGILGEQAGYLN